jgi:NADH:ubiquinone oxidoreductase subunit 2 (subunit N)
MRGMDDLQSWEINIWSLKIGIKIIMLSLMFKLGMAPFHFWLIKLYTNTNKYISVFLMTLPKIFYLFLFYKLSFLFPSHFFIFFSILSLFLASLFPLFFSRGDDKVVIGTGIWNWCYG